MVKTKEICRNSPRKHLRSGPVIKSTRRSLLTAKLSRSQANIRVVVRIRPSSHKESSENFKTVVNPLTNQLLLFDPEECAEAFFYHGVQQKGRDLLKRPNKNIQFSFDRVFNVGDNNEEVFKDSTQGLINSLMDGCNCSVFVYGATGSGKTYTMLGAAPNHPGITFLTMDELFKAKSNLELERKFEMHVSYLEVYNECVQDLLVNSGGSAGQSSTSHGSVISLQVQDSKFGVIVAGLTIRKITDAQELFYLLEKGNRNRTQHPTDANAESSRSHAVFQVYLQMDMIATGQRRMAKLSMIDLAGSERGAATGCKGARFTEGANINKSLLALGNCINALADGLRHVPYRDSKLTRLLKDSLGGNCHTVMIANISPSSLCYEDTYNTLKYANRAKRIKANVQKNVGVGDLHVTQYVKLLEERNAENERLKAENVRHKQEIEQLNEQLVLLKSCSAPVQLANVIDGSGDSEYAKDLEEIRAIFAERCNLEERKRKLQLNKKMLSSRLEFQDAEINRSGLYCNSPIQMKACAKSDAISIRLKKQIGTFVSELSGLDDSITKVDAQIKKFLELKPYVQKEYDKLLEQFIILKKDLQNVEYESLNKLALAQMARLGTQLDRTTKLLKPCFWLVRKCGYATQEIVSEYELITEAPHSVTWRPSPLSDKLDMYNIGLKNDGIDSGVSSTTTLMTNPSLTQLDAFSPLTLLPTTHDNTSLHSFRSPKRKFASTQNIPPIELDCTFNLGVHVAGAINTQSTPNLRQGGKHQSGGLQSNVVTGGGATPNGSATPNGGSVSSLNSLTTTTTMPSSKVLIPVIQPISIININSYTPPAAKRLARGLIATSRHSPRLQQQRMNQRPILPDPIDPKLMNNVKRVQQHGTMGTAPRFTSATTVTANRANRKPLAVTQRADINKRQL